MIDCLSDSFEINPSVVHESIVSNRYTDSWDASINSLAEEHLSTMNDEELDNDWKLNEFFGTIVVISLAGATERLPQLVRELQGVGVFDFEIFPAIDGRKDVDRSIWNKFFQNRAHIDTTTSEGRLALDRLHQSEAGCYMSHYLLIRSIKKSFENAVKLLNKALSDQSSEAIQKAKSLVKKYRTVLILEDDNGFGFVNDAGTAITKLGAGKHLRKALESLPDNWDMFYLMCAAHTPTKAASPHLRQISRSVFANAYVINYTMYDPLIKALEKIENPSIMKIAPLDKAISNIHAKHHVFAIYPSLAFQYNGISFIDSKVSNRLIQHQPIQTENPKRNH